MATAQPTLNAENLALGGGGTAYLSGVNALFYNPANLMIREHEPAGELVIGQLAFSAEPVISSEQLKQQWNYNRWFVKPYRQDKIPASTALTPVNRPDFLDTNFPQENDHRSTHFAYGESVHLGLVWRRPQKAWALGIRSRYGNRFTIGKGWYSADAVPNSNEELIIDRSLRQQIQVMHEVSFGFSQSFTYLNGLHNNLRRLYIGISPKFIIAGTYQDAVLEDKVFPQSDSSATNFNYRSSGVLTQNFNRHWNAMHSGNAAANPPFQTNELWEPTGYGAGIDFGLSYVLTLSDDLSILGQNINKKGTYKSIRLGLSITDLGWISYQENTFQRELIDDNRPTLNNTALESSIFLGSPGEFSTMVDHLPSESDGEQIYRTSSENYRVMLPTALHFGTLIEYNRMEVMGDVTLGLRKSAYYTDNPIYRLGVQLTPLKILPLRGGIQYYPGNPLKFSFGTGIETQSWSLNVGTMLSTRRNDVFYEVTASATGILQIRF